MPSGRILTLEATLTGLRAAVSDKDDGELEAVAVAHRVGIEEALGLIRPLVLAHAPDAIVHRVARGAAVFPEPIVVDGAMLERLCLMTGLDPAGMPVAINLLASVRAQYPLIPQIACFADDGCDVQLALAGRRVLAQRGRDTVAASPRTVTGRVRRWPAASARPPR